MFRSIDEFIWEFWYNRLKGRCVIWLHFAIQV